VDLATILGIVVALGFIVGGQAIEGGSLLQILQPTAAMIVFGGTLGATMNRISDVRPQAGSSGFAPRLQGRPCRAD